MKKQSNRLPHIVKMFFSGFLIIGLFTALCAQEKLPERPAAVPHVPFSKQAKTMPVSKSKITLKLTFDGEPFEVTQYEGGTIRIEKDGSTFGLSPYLDGDRVQIKAFKMFTVQNGEKILGEGVSALADFEVSTEAPEVNGTELGATIELLRIEREHRAKKKIDQPIPYLMENCCVTCNGTTLCACGVKSSCGSCCLQGCDCS